MSTKKAERDRKYPTTQGIKPPLTLEKFLLPRQEGKEKRKWCFLLSLLLLITFASYLNSLDNQFVFDDLHLIPNNPVIRGVKNIPAIVGGGARSGVYRPLRTISYALDYTLNEKLWRTLGGYQGSDKGLNPFGYHLTNCIFHLVTSLLVFLIVKRLTSSYRVAFLAASLFALHPVHTDSVTYISGRRDILFTLFYLLGFYWFLKFRETGRKRFIGGILCAYALSLGSKEMGVTLPGVCFFYDIIKQWSPGEHKGFWMSMRTVLARWWYFYLPAVAGALAYSYYKIVVAPASAQKSYYGDSILVTFLTVGKILVHYLGLLLLPVRLIADYSFEAYPLAKSFFEPGVMLSFMVLGVAGYGLLVLAGKSKVGAYGVIWFFLTLLPVCHIFPHHELLAEHYLYLPSVGLCLTVSLALENLMINGKYKKVVYSIVGTIVLLFSLRIVDRNKDWQDGFTLWSKTVEAVPRCARARDNLGIAFIERGMLDEAISEFKRALEVKPHYSEVYSNLGIAYAKKGDFKEAIASYTKALELDPRYAEAYYNLGIVHFKQGNLDEAITAYRKALRIKPNYLEAHNNLGSALQQKGDYPNALFHYYWVISLNPKFVKAYNNIGTIHYLRGNLNEAISFYEKALSIEPGYARARFSLGNVLSARAAACAQQGEYEEAVKYQERALQYASESVRETFKKSLELYQQKAREG